MEHRTKLKKTKTTKTHIKNIDCRVRKYIYIRTRTYTYTYTYTYIHIYIYTHTHAHTHIQTCKSSPIPPPEIHFIVYCYIYWLFIRKGVADRVGMKVICSVDDCWYIYIGIIFPSSHVFFMYLFFHVSTFLCNVVLFCVWMHRV